MTNIRNLFRLILFYFAFSYFIENTPFIAGMGPGDMLGAATGMTGGASGGEADKEKEKEPEEPKDETTEYSTNNGYHVFDGDTIKHVVDRNLRDDLFSKIDTLLIDLNKKVTDIDVNYEERISKMRESIESVIPKEEMATKLKLAELYKKEDEIHELGEGHRIMI